MGGSVSCPAPLSERLMAVLKDKYENYKGRGCADDEIAMLAAVVSAYAPAPSALATALQAELDALEKEMEELQAKIDAHKQEFEAANPLQKAFNLRNGVVLLECSSGRSVAFEPPRLLRGFGGEQDLPSLDRFVSRALAATDDDFHAPADTRTLRANTVEQCAIDDVQDAIQELGRECGILRDAIKTVSYTHLTLPTKA